jgi:hypothetical protein
MIKELAAYLKMSPSAIYKFTSTGTIPHYKMAKDYSSKEKKLMNGYSLPKSTQLTISKEKQRSTSNRIQGNNKELLYITSFPLQTSLAIYRKHLHLLLSVLSIS